MPGNRKHLLKYTMSPDFSIPDTNTQITEGPKPGDSQHFSAKELLCLPFPHTELKLRGAVIREEGGDTYGKEGRVVVTYVCLFVCLFFPFPLYLPSTKTGQMKTGKEKAE